MQLYTVCNYTHSEIMALYEDGWPMQLCTVCSLKSWPYMKRDGPSRVLSRKWGTTAFSKTGCVKKNYFHDNNLLFIAQGPHINYYVSYPMICWLSSASITIQRLLGILLRLWLVTKRSGVS